MNFYKRPDYGAGAHEELVSTSAFTTLSNIELMTYPVVLKKLDENWHGERTETPNQLKTRLRCFILLNVLFELPTLFCIGETE